MKKLKTPILGLVLPVLILIGMEVAARFELTTSQLFVEPKVIFETLMDLIKGDDLFINLGISTLRVFIGFVLGTVVGLLFGTAMGISRTFESYVGPIFNALRQVPVLAWIPLFILWVGIGEGFNISFIAVTAFFPMALNTCEGVKGVSKSDLEVGAVLEFNRFKQLSTIIIPASLPAIFTGLRLVLSITWMAVVGAELVVSGEGIGYMMYRARMQMQVDTVLVCILSIGLTGYTMNILLEHIEHYFLRWRKVVG
jgi:sulfonate transport system permease protein